MPRPRHIKTLEQTSIGANGFRLQLNLDNHLFEVIHAYHNGKTDKVDRTPFVSEHDARKYLDQLMSETKERINEFKPQPSYPLITKII